MAHKVINVTRYRDHYDELSQTPKNYVKENYFLKELQDKVAADWEYRPNRVDIEYEALRATMDRAREKVIGDDRSIWRPIEVVMQSVKSEKGKDISNDCRNIVFKNILEDRFNIGSKFRFNPDFVNKYDLVKGEDVDPHPALDGFDFDYDVLANDQDDIPRTDVGNVYINTNDYNKNVWLVTNLNKVNMTSSVIIERCNGTLGSTYVDVQGITHYHYEPVIQGAELSSVGLSYNEVAVSPQSQLLVVAQHNDFTREYHINQRFIIGYDKVYRIKAINKFYSNSTNNPEDVGLIRIYMELTESSDYDNFEKRIAYQEDHKVVLSQTEDVNYGVFFITPTKIPNFLQSEKINFTPVVRRISDNASVNTVNEDIPISVKCELENLPSHVSIDTYVLIEGLSDPDEKGYRRIVSEDGSFALARKRMYLNGDLKVTCYVKSKDSPSKDPFYTDFTLGMRSVN